MICTFALDAIVASGNGRTGPISMVTRSWAVTGCARWWAGTDDLAGSTISSVSARAMPAIASMRVSRWCGAPVWQDGGAEFWLCLPAEVVIHDLKPRAQRHEIRRGEAKYGYRSNTVGCYLDDHSDRGRRQRSEATEPGLDRGAARRRNGSRAPFSEAAVDRSRRRAADWRGDRCDFVVFSRWA